MQQGAGLLPIILARFNQTSSEVSSHGQKEQEQMSGVIELYHVFLQEQQGQKNMDL